MRTLPPSRNLAIGALARLFRNTTTSYKYLFAKSAFTLLSEGKGESRTLTLSDICIEMATNAWYPHAQFKLSFGRQDNLPAILDELGRSETGTNGTAVLNIAAFRENIQSNTRSLGVLRQLTRYVPLRLLTPFLHEELAGIADQNRNQVIFNHSNSQFLSKRLPYKLNGPTVNTIDSITFHDEWANYICENSPILIAWIDRHWIDYLQSRNPSIPAIPRKLEPPTERRSLDRPRRFWSDVLKTTQARCIYTGCNLDPDNFALDHFIPWSFIAHDQIWNLIPVTPAANALKSDRLPHTDLYLRAHAETQSKAIEFILRGQNARRYPSFADEYEIGLAVSLENLNTLDQIIEAYREACIPLISIAERHGFGAQWRYQG